MKAIHNNYQSRSKNTYAGYNTEGKTWEKKSGRYTITTKKQILQWSPEGEVEVYNKGTKQHLGGFDPKNASRQTGKIDVKRIPNGGWKVSTSILKLEVKWRHLAFFV